MSAELLIAIASAIGAIVSLIAAVSAFKKDDIKNRIDLKKLSQEEADRRRRIDQEVAEDTIGLYQKLSTQYEALNEKDKKLLRTITFVIRKMIVLERSVTDLMSEIETQWDLHRIEADSIMCPFYENTFEYMALRRQGIEEIIAETMSEIDALLLNGHTG